MHNYLQSRAFGAALVFCSFSAVPALADELVGTVGGPLRETSHTVSVEVSGGVAYYRVQRTVTNPGTIPDEAFFTLELPVGAVATGLRIKAASTWYDAELLDAAEAEAKYAELTGLGTFRPKDPALLYWDSLGSLMLRVFPVMPGKKSLVEYSFTVPTEYSNGRYFLSYPWASLENLAAPKITVTSSDAVALWVDENEVPLGQEFVLHSPSEGARGSVSGARSVLKSKDKDTIKSATLALDIDHTYRGDLTVDLVTPSRKTLPIHAGEGGAENGIHQRYELPDLAGQTLAGAWTLVIEDHAGVDVGTLKSWSLQVVTEGGRKMTLRAKDTPKFIPDAVDGGGVEGFHQIALQLANIDTVAARLGDVSLSTGNGASRLELDVAPQLRPAPKGLGVVFVLDASFSHVNQLETQIALAEAFLSHVPDAKAEVVLFRRKASPLFGELAPAKEFRARIQKAKAAGKLAGGNGSNLDAGFESAARVLSAYKGPTMIVALSDCVLRQRFTNQGAQDALSLAPARTFVHLLRHSPSNGEIRKERADSDPLAPLASLHGGVMFDVYTNTPSEEMFRAVMRGVVRPDQLDDVRYADLGEAFLQGANLPGVLHEGDGVRVMLALPENRPQQVTISGKLWQEAWSHTYQTDSAFSRTATAFLYSTDLYDAFTTEEQREAAFAAKAVSPHTSYLAIEPGVRPSTAGIRRSAMGFGSGSGAMGGSVGGVLGGLISSPPDLPALVRAAAQACYAKHPAPRGWSLSVEVETNYDEILDVLLTQTGSAPALASCLEEAVWNTRLDYAFRDPAGSYTLSFTDSAP